MGNGQYQTIWYIDGKDYCKSQIECLGWWRIWYEFQHGKRSTTNKSGQQPSYRKKARDKNVWWNELIWYIQMINIFPGMWKPPSYFCCHFRNCLIRHMDSHFFLRKSNKNPRLQVLVDGSSIMVSCQSSQENQANELQIDPTETPQIPGKEVSGGSTGRISLCFRPPAARLLPINWRQKAGDEKPYRKTSINPKLVITIVYYSIGSESIWIDMITMYCSCKPPHEDCLSQQF